LMLISSTHSGPSIHLTIFITSIHVNILIWLYDLIFALDPVFDLAIYVMQVCFTFILPWALHIAINRSRMKERQI
jgi:hypothetical protein